MMELIRSGLRNISRLKALALIFIFALTTANIAKAQQAPPSEHEKSTAQEITPEENTPEDEVDIQDSAEYQAYINALNTLDAAARLSAFEAFVRNFPKSALRPYALQRAMQARIELDNERTAPLQQELRQLRAAYEQAPHQPTPQQRACEMLLGLARRACRSRTGSLCFSIAIPAPLATAKLPSVSGERSRISSALKMAVRPSFCFRFES
jgi:hypothetical protein